ncbi:MAG: YciI family protein [Gammaproteobacteria bacterium]|nr:YciI family protein [Gammaproteobacteria bacterium]
MQIVIIGHDVPNSFEARMKARPDHLARLQQLDAEGRLIIAGPTPEDGVENSITGSVVIAEFDSVADARAWAEADPYVAAGVYASVDVKPFKKVLPA